MLRGLKICSIVWMLMIIFEIIVVEEVKLNVKYVMWILENIDVFEWFDFVMSCYYLGDVSKIEYFEK